MKESNLLIRNPFNVDQSYVVSVQALHELLTEISSPTTHWWVAKNFKKSVVLGFKSDKTKNLMLRFPKVARLKLYPGGDGDYVCLYPACRGVVQPGLYPHRGRLLLDDRTDWEGFWRPLQRALAEHYSNGLAGRVD